MRLTKTRGNLFREPPFQDKKFTLNMEKTKIESVNFITLLIFHYHNVFGDTEHTIVIQQNIRANTVKLVLVVSSDN